MNWSAVVWLVWAAAFLVLEIPAIYHRVPWTTLSDFLRHLEALSPVVPYAVAAGLGVLIAHLVRWP